MDGRTGSATRRRWAWGACGLAATIVLVVAVLAVVSIRRFDSSQAWLEAHGQPVTATVVQVHARGGEECGSYDVAFDADNGHRVQVHNVPWTPTADVQPGDRMSLFYDPAQPTRVRPAEDSAGVACGAAGAHVLVLVLVALGVFAVAVGLALVIRRRFPAKDARGPGPLET